MFSDEASKASRDYEEKFLSHPFLVELAHGQLPKKNFVYYIKQDNIFIRDMDLAGKILVSKHKSHDSKLVSQLLDSIYGHELREKGHLITKQLKIKKEDVEMAPTTLAYTSYLIRLASIASFEETLAALTPCLKLYTLIGERYAHCPASTHPIHGKWLAIYSSTPMKKFTNQLITILNSVARKAPSLRQAMMQSYLTACRFEIKFFDMAYQIEKWI
ncbi:MAG: hypothetical protein HY619_03475 [Thaumarchaeota archaeon]|nr:hypothetical protein [Nitrososphaerota archaeon]